MADESLSPNMEDYLEAIAILIKGKGATRVKDISVFLDVRKSSVTGAMHLLSAKGLIERERYGRIGLSVKGRKIARSICKKHTALSTFFSKILGISSKQANADACKVEHLLSKTTFHRLEKFIAFTELHKTDKRPQWLKHFDAYVNAGK